MYKSSQQNVVQIPNVWADETKRLLDDVNKKLVLITQEILEIKSRCNHTYSTGISALRKSTDPHDDSDFTRCEICQTLI